VPHEKTNDLSHALVSAVLVQSWSASVRFLDGNGKLERRSVWFRRYAMGPTAETRCRNAAEKARAAFQEYYEHTGNRWEKAARTRGSGFFAGSRCRCRRRFSLPPAG
jgi:hypothetical protein